jgi:L-2,4-diaminobutyrate decarboxylase
MAIFGNYFNPEGDPRPNPGLKSPPTTRPFSVLPIVTSLRHQGLKKLVERLRAPLEAIKETAHKIENAPGVELSLFPDTGILCFRVVPEDFPTERLNVLQEYIYNRIMNEGTRTVSKTKLGKDTVLRLVAISPSLTADDLMETVDCTRSLVEEFKH